MARIGASTARQDTAADVAPPADLAAPGARAAKVISALIVVLMVVAACGLWIDDLYRESEAVTTMLRAYDLVTLVTAAPLLTVALLPSLRGSGRAALLRLGVLAYAAYNYAFYAFGTTFNDLFLVHVALFGLSVFALALTAATMDTAGIAAAFSSRTPVRTISVTLALLGTGLGSMWIFYSLRFAVTGQVPEEPSALVVPTAITHLGWALDLAVLVPSYVTAAVLLWRRAAWGYVAATALLVAGALHQIAYLVALLFQAGAEVPGASAFDRNEPVIAAAFLAGAAVLLYASDHGRKP